MEKQGAIYQTGILTFSGLRCRIQMREIPGGWQQRHVWYPPTPHVETVSVEEWIYGGTRAPGATFSKLGAA